MLCVTVGRGQPEDGQLRCLLTRLIPCGEHLLLCSGVGLSHGVELSDSFAKVPAKRGVRKRRVLCVSVSVPQLSSRLKQILSFLFKAVLEPKF